MAVLLWLLVPFNEEFTTQSEEMCKTEILTVGKVISSRNIPDNLKFKFNYSFLYIRVLPNV